MRAKGRMIALVAAALVISACSREGFEQSLERQSSPEEESSQSQQQDLSHEDFIFDLDIKEYEEDKSLYIYALPQAVEEKAEAPAGDITRQLQSIIDSLSAEVAAGREYEDFSVYDAITCNDGRIFSVLYEISFTPVDGEQEEYMIGLVFDPVTGKRRELSELIDVNTLITLISDEQASTIPGRNEELVAQKRDYIREEGEEQLLDRITAEGGLDVLLDASFYVDGSDLVAVFSAVEQLGEPVEVSIDL